MLGAPLDVPVDAATPALPPTVENPVEPMRIVELDANVRKKYSKVEDLFGST